MVTFDDTYGALLIGVVVAAILYGITCIQTWYYYTYYPSDPWYIKLLVAGILFTDTCHQVLITDAVYTYLVTKFGVVEELEKIVWSLVVQVFFNGFTTLFVQCFLAMRVYRLSNKNWLATGSVMILVIGHFLMVLIYSAKAVHFDTFAQVTALKTLSMSINVAAAAADILICVFLCYLLQRSRTVFRKSNTMINQLIMFSINTGLLTSLDAIASLVSISVSPNTFIYITFYFSIGGLYSNSLLATLNARKRLRRRHEVTSLSPATQQCTNHSFLGARVPSNIFIKVDTTRECVRDEISSSGDVKNHEDV